MHCIYIKIINKFFYFGYKIKINIKSSFCINEYRRPYIELWQTDEEVVLESIDLIVILWYIIL